MGTFRRHLSVLLWKNSVLKRRHPCSLFSELFLAIGSIGLLTLARHLTSNLETQDFEAEHHVMKSMLVRLPECAEFLPDCSVELVKTEAHSASCVEGITFGCKGDVHHTGRPGVWAVMGCYGLFRVKGHQDADEHYVHCKAKSDGGAKTCASSACDIPEPHREPCDSGFGLQPSECLKRSCCFDARRGQCFRSKSRRLQSAANTDQNTDSFSTGALMDMLLPKGGVRRLDATFAVAPKGHGAEEFHTWLRATRHPWADRVRLFDTAEDVEQHLRSDTYPRRNQTSSEMLCGAVIFDTEPWSQQVKYTLRFNQSLGYDPNLPSVAAVFRSTKLTTQGLVEPQKDGQPKTFNKGGLTWYSQSGFLALQRSVDNFIERISYRGQAVSGPVSSQYLGEDGRPHVVVPFPTPAWSLDVFAMLMPQLLSAFLLISLAYSVNRMITGVVMEREARLREGMRMMGMRSSAFYASWVVTYVLLYLFVVTGVVFLLSVGSILPRSSPSLLFVWLMIFSLAAIAYGLVITTFFTRAKTAATVGSILFYTTSYFKHLANPTSSSSTLRLLSLLPPVAFELGADLVAALESQQVGVTWANANIHYHNYSLLESAVMLLLDTLCLSVLFLYLDQVMPREVGIQRPWYFPVSPSFWADILGKAPTEAPHVDVEAPTASSEAIALVEQDVGEAAAMMSRNGQTVEIVKLSKRFGQLRAVENLDLVMYQGEIFALLGHNGAGKTTTLGMLCGLIPPSSGRCSVFGSDRPEEVQRYLGVCPQHDVLWETMTCEEHLKLFAGFKGVPNEAVSREVSYMLDRVGLEKAGACKTQAGRLSGGMKRKLSLGIAFLGGSRLVVLDEPTSGLDPFSRRSVWELLRSMKQGRVTVLSTHYMDEADILGDRIAILHEGRLKCCGSPQFLKRAYDCGYNVTFVKRPGCDIDIVREAVCRHVPELTSEVSVLSNSGKELILQFPFSAARHFPKVLGSLEQQLEELRLESYGISVTTLEEVFLKVASGDVPRSRQAPSPQSPQSPAEQYIELQEMAVNPVVEEVQAVQATESSQAREVFAAPKYRRGGSCLGQTKALVKKRIKYGVRDHRGVLCQLLMPTTALVLFLVLLSRKLFSSQPILELAVQDYNKHCHGSSFRRRDFSNRVEFSHLPVVNPEKAMEVLKPGEELWHGELRHHSPPLVSDEEMRIEEAVFVSTPKLIQSALKLEKGRKLSQANASKASKASTVMLKFLVDRYSSFLRAQETLEAIAQSFPAKGDRLISSWTNFAHSAVDDMSQFKTGEGRRLFSYGNRGFDRLCPTATSPERMLWQYLDRDRDNVISQADLQLALEDMEKRHNSSVAKMITQGLAREEMRQQLGFDIPPGTENQMATWLDWIAEEAVISFLDVDGDGIVSIEDFCQLGTQLKGQAGHLVDLAQSFSEDILKSSSVCPRYGAFYVVAQPRTDDTYGIAAKSDAIIFANVSSKHSAAVYQAALTNARLARLKRDKTVAVNVHLFPQTKDEQIVLERFAVFMLSVYITFCLSFIPAGISHYLVKERSSGARQLQALSGASHFSYWFANMIYDVVLYVLPAISVPVALHAFGYHAFLKGDCGKALFAVLAAFGPAIAGFSYIVSFMFKDHSRASNTILTFCLVGAIVLSTVLFVLAIINYDPAAQYPSACDYPTEDHPEGTCRSPGARTADRILGPLFRMVPTVCVYQALFAIALVANPQAVIPEGAMDALQAVGGDNVPHVSLKPLAFEWAGEPLLYLVVEGFAFFFLAILLDAAIHSPRLARQVDAATCRYRLNQLMERRRSNDEARLSPLIESSSILEGDDSVWAERERAAMATKEELALHVWDLEKTYQRWASCRSPKRAVRGVSFAIHSGEVFGLLGHNGAGKTSSIKCFVGEQCCSTGAVHVGGFDMEKQTSKARQRLGYCPQFDALLELLTVEDHLEFYAAIRGLPKQAVEDSLQDFKLAKLARRRAEVLSGGNKRKLSAALALMGSPSLAILDEPSCGLDPAARRALWTAVHEAVGITSPVGYSSAGASAVLLTTHSMEEAEALSNRLGIMANGQLLTVGTAQQIKAKHGSCHELMLRLRPETEEALSNMTRQWPAQLDSAAVGKILESDAWKRAAFARPRCIVQLQLEQSGVVESSVLAEWFLQQANGEKVEKFLSNLLGDRVELAEDFGIYWRFRLPRSGLSIPQLFQQLEDNAENFGVAEYTLSQATLEQIFNSITEGADTHGAQSG